MQSQRQLQHGLSRSTGRPIKCSSVTLDEEEEDLGRVRGARGVEVIEQRCLFEIGGVLNSSVQTCEAVKGTCECEDLQLQRDGSYPCTSTATSISGAFPAKTSTSCTCPLAHAACSGLQPCVLQLRGLALRISMRNITAFSLPASHARMRAVLPGRA